MTDFRIQPTAATTGFSPVLPLLRLEALAVLGLSIAAYAWLGLSWWLFAALILAPDLALLGYLRGPRAGAWLYDLAHTYIVPTLLALAGYVLSSPLLMGLAAIWAAHIGLDRMVGYGLKFPTDARDNHLSRLKASG